MTDRIAAAESFLRSCLRGGLAHSLDVDTGRWVKPYPEVTGYLLSYFANTRPAAKIPTQVHDAGRRLLSLQHATGGFASFGSRSRLFAFDTAQILHGFASMHGATGGAEYIAAADRGAVFVRDMQVAGGGLFPVYDVKARARYVEPRGDWGIRFSYIQTKDVEGLRKLQAIHGDDRYQATIDGLVRFGRTACDLTFTHPGAYCLEGLLDAGEADFVRDQLARAIVPRIADNGFLSYSPALPYAYVSGSVQMGILLHKAGLRDASRSILEWARGVQARHPSGGLFQYADRDGALDRTVHSEINSWGTKYYCELERLWLGGG